MAPTSETPPLDAPDQRLTAYEASCFQNFLFLLLLTSQVSKRINDDTKDEVQDDDDDDEIEEEVINNSRSKQRLLKYRMV